MDGDARDATDGSGRVARGVVYVLSRASERLDGYVLTALRALRHHVETMTVVATTRLGEQDLDRLRDEVDRVVLRADDEALHRLYAVEAARMGAASGVSEIILTGDGWFGPVTDLERMFAEADRRDLEAWELVESPHGVREEFPDEGFPRRRRAWLWTVVGKNVLASPAWRTVAERGGDLSSHEVIRYLSGSGFRTGYLFEAVDYGSHDPALFAARALVEDGCPLIDVEALSSFPPHLERFGAIGRETVATAAERGYPVALLWEHLARTVPPKALNAIGGMLEILPGEQVSYDSESPFRIAAIVHAGDLDDVEEILDRLSAVPGPLTLIVTTTDGLSAARLRPMLDAWTGRIGHDHDLRVTPASPGRDMSDFFVACRDILLSDDFDLVIKVHARRSHRKTVNVRRYFRRYQLENLLDDAEYIKSLLALFQAEPGLGLVFPPMIHIGYATMGRGWAGLRDDARQLCRMIDVGVPLDVGSPLAPYGAMFVARPEALRSLSEYRWTYADYSGRSANRFGRLAHVQERLLTATAAQRGFHTRTVLTAEHAAISHTALDWKVDEMSTTTRGWPVEQIRLLHRAGATGYGGAVALSRMYLRVNHPRAAHVMRPLYRAAFRAYAALSWGVATSRRVTGRGRGER